jgi:hypothetical protein
MPLVRRLPAAIVAMVAMVVLGGCGGDGESAPPTTVTTEPAPTTTIEQGDAQGIACLNVSTQGLKLRNDYNQAARGIVAPDPDPYRQTAATLRAEHDRLGCPGDLLRGFLED